METMNRKLYTLLVYSENIAGVLSKITAAFTRRQINIDSINVSDSGVEGVQKYIITALCDEEQVKTMTRQLEKKIDIIKANYYTDDELLIGEIGMYKIAADCMLENKDIQRVINKSNARIIENNSDFCCAMLSGTAEEITNLYNALDKYNCLLQYTSGGRIAVTRTNVEHAGNFFD